MVKIGLNTQGDWQELDPQVAERVRAVESNVVIAEVIGTYAGSVYDLFNNHRTAELVATDVRHALDARVGVPLLHVGDQVEADIAAGLTEALRREQLNPAGTAIERDQRQAKMFADAIRRAIPADVLSRIGTLNEVEPQRAWYNPRRYLNGTTEFLKDHSAYQLGFTNNSEGRIIRELAQSDTIRAPGNPPKWSALNYPRLMTAFCAMRKLRDDPASKIHLKSTQYYATQMEEISNLLVDRFHEQLERDYAREPETDQQRTERRAQGEFQRRQRLTRMLTNEPLPATYEERAGAAITEATGKIRTFGDRIRQIFTGDTTRTPTGGRSPYTWPARSVKSAGTFAVNRGKNLMGEGSAFNPITYPARGLKAFWKFGTTPLGG